MAEENVQPEAIKYLDLQGLQALWRKIGDLYPRTTNLGTILDALEDPFIRKSLYDEDQEEILKKLEELEIATGNSMDGDTIIKTENGKIATNIIMDIDEESKTLRLVTRATDSNNNTPKVISEIDYRPFVKDGMLDSVSIVVKTDEDPETGEPTGEEAGTYLKFIFNTDAGKEAIYLNATEFVNVYVGDDYININGDKVSLNTVALDSHIEEYLKKSVYITDIVTRLDDAETTIRSIQGDVQTLNTDVANLKAGFETLQGGFNKLEQTVSEYDTRLDTIEEVLTHVPTEPITVDEINKLP